MKPLRSVLLRLERKKKQIKIKYIYAICFAIKFLLFFYLDDNKYFSATSRFSQINNKNVQLRYGTTFIYCLCCIMYIIVIHRHTARFNVNTIKFIAYLIPRAISGFVYILYQWIMLYVVATYEFCLYNIQFLRILY